MFPQHVPWEFTRRMLNALVVNQRVYSTLLRVKELQQYAEELVRFARANDHFSNRLVESILITPEARSILYEYLVPRYAEHIGLKTRVTNLYDRRERDSAYTGQIEFVDVSNAGKKVQASRDQARTRRAVRNS